jgi:hypothetical protein
MSNDYEVISAFLDEEPFDGNELAAALSEPAGRALLIDLITLRQIVQPPEQAPAMTPAPPVRRPLWFAVAAAAAVVVALAGGYWMGERQSVPASVVDAPPASRVVQAEPFTPTGDIR